MKFVTNVKENEYDEFVRKNKEKSHFLQSYSWGKFQESVSDRTAHYLGVKNSKGELIAATMLLQKKLYFGLSYFYGPRAFVIDFFDFELLSFFTKELKKYVKNKKGIFLKIDPDFIIERHNYKDEKIELSYDWNEVFANLKNIGYKHKGFSKNFETAQPRYSFRIDLKQDEDKIIDHFAKTTQKRIKKSEGFKVEIETSDDIEAFYKLMRDTEERKSFINYDLNHYKKLFKVYGKDEKVKLYLAYIYPKKIIKEFEDKIQSLEKQITKVNNLKKYNENFANELKFQLENSIKQKEEYEDALEKHGEKILLNAHIIIYYGNKAWALYAGNHNEFQDLGSNYQLYKKHILDSKKDSYEIYDNFGASGDLSKNNPLIGLYIMKKGFGGDFVEFIGEFDLVTNKFMYFIFTKLIGSYRALKKKSLKRKRL